jgi:hypothetical protein
MEKVMNFKKQYSAWLAIICITLSFPALSEEDVAAQRKAICELRMAAAIGAPGSNTFSASMGRASQALADCMEGRAPSPPPQQIIIERPSLIEQPRRRNTNCVTNYYKGTATTSCY